MNWDDKFISLAKNILTWSKDKSTKVGAVIVNSDKRVVSMGYNGAPTGFPDDLEYIHERPTKYFYFEHAERNAIYNAARLGISTVGCTIYIIDDRKDHLFCCADCARAIVQSGISIVVICRSDNRDKNWDKSCEAALDIFNKCNIKIRYYNE